MNGVITLVTIHVHLPCSLLFLFVFKVFVIAQITQNYLNLQYPICDHLGAVKTTCKWDRMAL